MHEAGESNRRRANKLLLLPPALLLSLRASLRHSRALSHQLGCRSPLCEHSAGCGDLAGAEPKARSELVMAWDLVLWLIAFFSVIALIALTAYQLICLSDLEFDYINPYDSSARINAVVIPEFLVQGALCLLFFLTWHWFPFLIMAPITYYHAKLYVGRKHLVDVTEIFSLLNEEKKRRLIKLAFYVSLFIIIIYRLVMAAVVALIDEDDGPLDSGIF